MADLTDAEFDAANERGRIEFETKPHAASAEFDRSTGLMTLRLYNGCSFTFAPRELQGLDTATDDQIEAFELSFAGYGLHWDELDADFTVPGLLAGSFGTAEYMLPRRTRLGDVYRRLVARSDTGRETQAAE